MAIILFLLLIFCPCASADCGPGDVQEHLDTVYGRGAVVSVFVNDGKVTKVQVADGADKQAIQATVDAFDMKQKGRAEINQEIQSEIDLLANDKSIEDGKQAEIRAKLERAKDMSTLQDKKDKLQEAKDAKVEALNPDNKPRIVDAFWTNGPLSKPLPYWTGNPVLPHLEKQ